jgi:hypothetical protein
MLGEHASSKYAEEMRRWEAYPSKYGQPGRPFKQQDYPKMLYRCEFIAGQGIQTVDKHTVDDDVQERNMNSRGFYPLQEAYDRVLAQQTEYGKLAAEREYQIQHGRVSERAVAEVRAAEAEHGAAHMPDVPVTPIKRRGRKPKAVANA